MYYHRRRPAGRAAASAAAVLAVLVWFLVPVTHCAGGAACGHSAVHVTARPCCHDHGSSPHGECADPPAGSDDPRDPVPHSPGDCPLCQVALTAAPAVVAIAPPLPAPARVFVDRPVRPTAPTRLVHVLTDAPPRGPPSAFAS
jgi:hypothetical protein